MNNDGNIVFFYKEEICIYLVNKIKIEKFVDMFDWILYGFCFNLDGELLVCM